MSDHHHAHQKSYIGDGVYVDVEHGMLILTTEDGSDRPNNRICLEQEVWESLLLYIDRLKAGVP